MAANSVQGMHAAIDALLAEWAVMDPSGKSVERWCEAQRELHESLLRSARRRQAGEATLKAAIEGGRPNGHKPISAGFVASISGG